MGSPSCGRVGAVPVRHRRIAGQREVDACRSTRWRARRGRRSDGRLPSPQRDPRRSGTAERERCAGDLRRRGVRRPPCVDWPLRTPTSPFPTSIARPTNRAPIGSSCVRPIDIVIVEGNYLLLDSAPWVELRDLFDAVAHLDVDPVGTRRSPRASPCPFRQAARSRRRHSSSRPTRRTRCESRRSAIAPISWSTSD